MNINIGRYDNPAAVGGWLGWVEPRDKSWILFVPIAGAPVLYPHRDPETGAVID